MQDQHQRNLSAADLLITECNDGTICENSAPCMPHPTREGSYMCDCRKAHDSNNNQIIKYAGVYCEHKATSYCQRDSETSVHTFCTNRGECKRTVGRTEEHAGCKCPGGYEGGYCQFVEGSMPSDWTLDNYMHPSLASLYGMDQESSGMSSIFGVLIGTGVASVLIVILVVGFLYRFGNEKENTVVGEESTSLAGRRSSYVVSTGNASFVGGKSVYRKKTDTIEADGGVLTEALGDQGLMEPDFVDLDQKTSMEEVNLDDEKPGELA